MKGTLFVDCNITKRRFTDTDASLVQFKNCDLSNAIV